MGWGDRILQKETNQSLPVSPQRQNTHRTAKSRGLKLPWEISLHLFFAQRSTPPVEQKLPELDEEIEPGVNARIEKRAQQTEYMQGQLIDKVDELNAHINIPNFKDVQKDVEAHRLEKAQHGQYISRVDSYELLLAKGIVLSPTKPALKIMKSPVKVVTNKTKTINRGKSETNFKELSITDKEASLEDKLF